MKKFLVSFTVFFAVITVGVASMKPETAIAAALTSVDKMISLGMNDVLARFIGDTIISVNSSGNLVLPVASGKKLSVTVAGTERASVSATGVVSTTGDFIAATSGGTLSLQEATAGAACSGSVTANATTPVVVSTTCATTGSRILLQKTSTSVVNGSCYRSALSNGVSFTITCLASDTGTYDWFIIHEAP